MIEIWANQRSNLAPSLLLALWVSYLRLSIRPLIPGVTPAFRLSACFSPLAKRQFKRGTFLFAKTVVSDRITSCLCPFSLVFPPGDPFSIRFRPFAGRATRNFVPGSCWNRFLSSQPRRRRPVQRNERPEPMPNLETFSISDTTFERGFAGGWFAKSLFLCRRFPGEGKSWNTGCTRL